MRSLKPRYVQIDGPQIFVYWRSLKVRGSRVLAPVRRFVVLRANIKPKLYSADRWVHCTDSRRPGSVKMSGRSSLWVVGLVSAFFCGILVDQVVWNAGVIDQWKGQTARTRISLASNESGKMPECMCDTAGEMLSKCRRQQQGLQPSQEPQKDILKDPGIGSHYILLEKRAHPTTFPEPVCVVNAFCPSFVHVCSSQ